MKDGVVKGYFVIGQNPASSGLNAEQARAALERLDWMVVLDAYETETASFWRREGADPAIDRNRVLLHSDGDRARERGHDDEHQPAAAVARQGRRSRRRCDQRSRVHPPARRAAQGTLCGLDRSEGSRAARSDVGLRARRRARAGARRAVGAQGAAGDQRLSRRAGKAARRVRASRGVHRARGRRFDRRGRLDLHRRLSRQGDEPRAQPARRRVASLDWGFAWPANRRMLYNRASADPDGKPWSERKKYVWWNAEARQVGRRRRARLPRDESAVDAGETRRVRHRRALGRGPVHHAARRPRATVRDAARSRTARSPRTTSRSNRSCRTSCIVSSTTRRCANGAARDNARQSRPARIPTCSRPIG